MSKFVVTGARGYVSKQLIRRLNSEGHEVIGLTRAGGVNLAECGSLEVAVGDYTDEALLARTISGAQAVFHLAARAHQRSAGEDDSALFHAANVVPTETLARACAVADVRRLVMLSSIGVLGSRTDQNAFSDTSVPAPVEPYAISKVHAERRVSDILSGRDCDYCILRPPLVYGPGSPGNFASLVAIAAKAPLVPLGGIRAPRTFIHIDHLVDALVVAATNSESSRRTFVISDGEDTTVAEIVDIAARFFAREPWRIVAVPEILLRTLSSLVGQDAILNKLLAPLRVDCSGFQQATGWRPAQSTSEAIAATIRNWPQLRL